MLTTPKTGHPWRALRPLVACVGLLVGAGMPGCDVTTDTDLASTQAALVVQNMWSRADFPISVCFEEASDSTSAERDLVRDAVENSWGAGSDLVTFTGWDTCAEGGADIDILHSSSVSRPCSVFGTAHQTNSGPCNGRMELPTPDSATRDYLTYAYLHEFGHALGIRHSQSHPDKEVDDPGCSHDENVGDGTVAGPYDPDSVMNYCAGTPTVLSIGDELNIQLMYPDFPFIGVGDTNDGLWTKGSLAEGWSSVANSVGIRDVAVMNDGTLVGVGSTNYALFQKSCLTCPWIGVQNSGGVRSVAVMNDGALIGVGSTVDALFHRGCLTCSWTGVPNSEGVQDVAVMPDGTILGVGSTSDSLWTKQSLTADWQPVPNSAGVRSVEVLDNGVILGVGNTSFSLFSKLTLTDDWHPVPNSAGVRMVAYGDFNE